MNYFVKSFDPEAKTWSVSMAFEGKGCVLRSGYDSEPKADALIKVYDFILAQIVKAERARLTKQVNAEFGKLIDRSGEKKQWRERSILFEAMHRVRQIHSGT